MIIAQLRDGFQRHVAGTLDNPFVVLLEQDRSDEADDGVLIGEDADDLGSPLDLAVKALDQVCNRYESSRRQRSAAVFYIVAYGATIGIEAPGARCAGRPIHTMSRELELVAGRLCDSPGCAESAYAQLSCRPQLPSYV